MRIAIILICLSLNLYSNAQTSWEWLSPKPSGLTGEDVLFIDHQNGFIVKSNEILKTSDGGVTWEVQVNISSGKRISFKNSIGVIIGNSGSIYKSTDSGDSWHQLFTNFNDNLNAITILDDNTLYITSDKNLFVSNDGGMSWVSHPVPGVNIEDSYFTSSSVGHAACTNGTIVKTVDGGESWYVTESSNVSPSDFFKITFVNENIGYASQEHNDIYKTIDGGESWSEIKSPIDAAYSIHFINSDVGFVAGEDGAMYKTLDGGNSWEWIGFDGRKYANDIYSIFFLNENEGYATGLRGRIIKTTDGGATWDQYSLIYNNIDKVQFVSKNVGYLEVGNDYFRTDDGGYNWEYVGTPKHYDGASGFQFINENIGYSIGGGPYNGFVFKTIDGGLSWNKLDITVGEGISSLFFLDKNLGFISGGFNSRKVLKTIDGGITWQQVSTEEFGLIQFLNEKVGYANRIGYSGGRIYKTTDGGNTWEVNFDISEEITSFHFVNDSVGYFVGDNALMYKTQDGGDTWEKLDIPYEYYEYVKFYSNNLGFILDEEGRLYRTLDGGENWENIYRLHGISSIELNEMDIYISGEFGSLLRSTIDYNALINLAPLSLVNISDSTATVSSLVHSSLNTTKIYIEIGTQTGDYEQSFEIGLFDEFFAKTISYTFKKLNPATEYFCQLKIIDGDRKTVSSEFSFTTKSEVITGIENNEKESTFSIHPNPTNEFIKIKGSKNQFIKYFISDLRGNFLLQGEISAEIPLDVSSLNNGFYILRLDYGNGSIITSKFIKQ